MKQWNSLGSFWIALHAQAGGSLYKPTADCNQSFILAITNILSEQSLKVFIYYFHTSLKNKEWHKFCTPVPPPPHM